MPNNDGNAGHNLIPTLEFLDNLNKTNDVARLEKRKKSRRRMDAQNDNVNGDNDMVVDGDVQCNMNGNGKNKNDHEHDLKQKSKKNKVKLLNKDTSHIDDNHGENSNDNGPPPKKRARISKSCQIKANLNQLRAINNNFNQPIKDFVDFVNKKKSCHAVNSRVEYYMQTLVTQQKQAILQLEKEEEAMERYRKQWDAEKRDLKENIENERAIRKDFEKKVIEIEKQLAQARKKCSKHKQREAEHKRRYELKKEEYNNDMKYFSKQIEQEKENVVESKRNVVRFQHERQLAFDTNKQLDDKYSDIVKDYAKWDSENTTQFIKYGIKHVLGFGINQGDDHPYVKLVDQRCNLDGKHLKSLNLTGLRMLGIKNDDDCRKLLGRVNNAISHSCNRIPNGYICLVCHDDGVEVKYNPCGHLCVCKKCYQSLCADGNMKCPACNVVQTDAHEIYIAGVHE